MLTQKTFSFAAWCNRQCCTFLIQTGPSSTSIWGNLKLTFSRLAMRFAHAMQCLKDEAVGPAHSQNTGRLIDFPQTRILGIAAGGAGRFELRSIDAAI